MAKKQGELTAHQKSAAKAILAELDENDKAVAALAASREEIIVKLHGVAGARKYIHNGQTLTPVVRKRNDKTEAFLRGENLAQAVDLDA